mgnify:FL=1|jgi:hypothetical protein
MSEKLIISEEQISRMLDSSVAAAFVITESDIDEMLEEVTNPQRIAAAAEKAAAEEAEAIKSDDRVQEYLKLIKGLSQKAAFGEMEDLEAAVNDIMDKFVADEEKMPPGSTTYLFNKLENGMAAAEEERRKLDKETADIEAAGTDIEKFKEKEKQRLARIAKKREQEEKAQKAVEDEGPKWGPDQEGAVDWLAGFTFKGKTEAETWLKSLGERGAGYAELYAKNRVATIIMQYSEELDEQKSAKALSNALDKVQAGLDIAGVLGTIPVLSVISTPANLISLVLNTARGNYGAALFDLIAAVPVAGSYFKAGNAGVKAGKAAVAAEKAYSAAKASKSGATLIKSLGGIKKIEAGVGAGMTATTVAKGAAGVVELIPEEMMNQLASLKVKDVIPGEESDAPFMEWAITYLGKAPFLKEKAPALMKSWKSIKAASLNKEAPTIEMDKFDFEDIPEGLLDSDEFFQKYVKLDEKEATRLGFILQSFREKASQDERGLAKSEFNKIRSEWNKSKTKISKNEKFLKQFKSVTPEYPAKIANGVYSVMKSEIEKTKEKEKAETLTEGQLIGITIDFSEIRRKQKYLDESFLVMFGGWVKWLLGKMFGGGSIPGNIKGSKSEVESFARAMGSEKRYIETAKRYGLDHPTTYKSKAKLSSATKGFEKETGIKWPFE